MQADPSGRLSNGSAGPNPAVCRYFARELLRNVGARTPAALRALAQCGRQLVQERPDHGDLIVSGNELERGHADGADSWTPGRSNHTVEDGALVDQAEERGPGRRIQNRDDVQRP